MHNRRVWLKPLALALSLALSIPLNAAPPAADAVQTITRDQIERSGAATLADYLRRLPRNSLGSFRPGPFNYAPLAELSVHGLGGARTLLLIDGHPAPVSAVNGQWQNLAQIPLALVERIEIRDIASGTAQGSRAMTGSVNIVLRRLPDGVEVSAGYADPQGAGGAQQQAAALLGFSGERGSLSIDAAHERSDAVVAGDRAWLQPGRSTQSNNFLTAIPLDPVGAMSRPGNLLAHPTQGAAVPGGCNAPGFSLSGSGSTARCLYDYNRVRTTEPELSSDMLLVSGALSLGDDWRLGLDASVSRARAAGVEAPDLIFPELAIAWNSPNHPAVRFPTLGYDPNRPLHLRHRFIANGNRETDSEDRQSRVSLGLDGQIGAADVEFRLFQDDSRFEERISNQIIQSLAQQAINDGSYNIYDPFATSPAVLDAISATAHRDGRYRAQGFDATATLPIGDFAGGSGQLRTSAHYLDESYRNDGADPIVAQTVARPESAGRSRAAVGIEASLPLLETLSADLGVRQDRYSDSGGMTSGQLLLAYTPAPAWRFSASFGRGLRAPDLATQALTPSFSLEPLSPRASCALFQMLCDRPPLLDEVYSLLGQFIANPELAAERTQQINLGIEWSKDEQLRVSLDGWHTRIEGTFARLPGTLIVECALGLADHCPRGIRLFAAGTDFDPALGMGLMPRVGDRLAQVQYGLGNVGTTAASGADLRIEWQGDLGDAGRLGSMLWLGWVDRYQVDGANRLNEIGQPHRRASLDSHWDRSDFSFSWQVNLIGGGSQSRLGVEGVDGSGHLPTWTSHDLQARWRAPWNAEFVVGVRNIGNRKPVIDPYAIDGGNYSANYDGNGRTPYLQYRQRW